MSNYLVRLTVQLTEGLAKLPDEVRALHTRYLLDKQNAEGGYSGREGESDLYYTAFGLRGLAVLDALTPEVCEKATGYLKQAMTGEANVVDFFSLLYACGIVQMASGIDVLADSAEDWPDRVAEALEGLRTEDGGYRKTEFSPQGSTYHTFLVGLCYQLLGRSVPDVQKAVDFVLARQREDGGFVEVAAQRKSGTNPTAAAVGFLQVVEPEVPALTEELRENAISFLAQMTENDEGGLTANTRAPLTDLLSTFTGAWTLYQLDALEDEDFANLKRYVEALSLEGGGFRGGLWDDGDDVEYTFYGLGVSGLAALGEGA